MSSAGLNVLITGANRGIGLSLAQQYLSRGANVLSVVRNPTEEIKATSSEIIPDIDLTKANDVEKLKGAVGGRRLDIVINNAGIFGMNTLQKMDWPSLEQQFQINAVAPLRVTTSLLDNVEEGSKLVFISSMIASIGDNNEGGLYGYRMSKAALNAAGKSLAVDLRPRGIHVGLIHPGFVSTRLTNFKGDISPDESAKGIMELTSGLNAENSGGFWDWNGDLRNW